MPIYVKVNGKMRECVNVYTKVDGELREISNIDVNVEGEQRPVLAQPIKEKDIIGVKIVYTACKDVIHPEHPELRYNNTIPVYFSMSEHSDKMSMSEKSVVFEYTNDDPYNEGFMLYEGRIYAILNDHKIVDLTDTSSAYKRERLKELTVKISGYTYYEVFGHYMNGWNSIFSTKQFLDTNVHDDRGPYKGIDHIVDYILSTESPEFNPSSYIGIARDQTSVHKNMVGSHGTLDHTFYEIKINDVLKPFAIEINN